MNAATAMRQLYGRTVDELVRDVQSGAQRLATASRSWSTVAPQRPAIDDALSSVVGLQRVLAELHSITPKPGETDA